MGEFNSNLIELSTKVNGKDTIYTGRFLGFIKDDEFNALVQSTDNVAARLESKATLPIMDVAAKFDIMTGHRLIMTVKKVNGASTVKKTLFITEPLLMIDSVSPSSSAGKPGEVTFQAREDNSIVVRETI